MLKRNETWRCLNCVLILFTVLVLYSFLTGCVQTGTQKDTLQSEKQDGLPVDIQGKNLKRGLKAIYFFDKYRKIDEMPKSEKSIAKYGHPAKPILKIDHEFGKGNVFDSGRSQEIGVLMTGYMHLDKPGTYLFQAKSNDGFQMILNDELIVSDPGVHGDRLSEPGEFRVNQGGMFPVEIKYFQRKGTATLRLYWQLPETRHFTIVPSVVYSHIGD